MLMVLLAVAEFFDKRPQLRIDRNHKTLISLVAINDDLTQIEIDVASFDRRGLSLSQAGESQEFNKIARLFRVSIKTLRTNIGNDRLKLLPGRCLPDRFLSFTI